MQKGGLVHPGGYFQGVPDANEGCFAYRIGEMRIGRQIFWGLPADFGMEIPGQAE